MTQAARAPLALPALPASLLRGFLDPEVCRQVAEMAEAMHQAGELCRNVFQGSAFFVNLDQRDALRPTDPGWAVIDRLVHEIVAALQPGPRGPDTYLGDFLSYITPGGFVVRHRDDWQLPDPEARCRVRCNTFVSKDPGSGDPCLGPEGDELRLRPETGDLLVFSPSLTPHRATRVVGGPKIMVSIGFVVETAAFLEILRRIGSPVAA